MTPARELRLSYDAIVVGARCAGAATAMLLARRGLRVLAIDKGRHGADALSTHALMRGGVLQLFRWGLLDRVRATTPPVRTTTFHYGDHANEVPIKPGGGIDALYAPRRTVLDALLSDAAAESGAEVVYGLRLVDLLRDGTGRVIGVVLEDRAGGRVSVRSGVVIGADGAGSAVARLTGAPETRSGRHATGVAFGYWSGVRLSGYHWHFGRGTSAGAIVTTGGDVCVFASTTAERFAREVRRDPGPAYRQILGECAPSLLAALEGATPVTSLRSFAGQVGFMRRPWGPGWALVGDAGYFKDPITAHGITDALRDAELLASAVVEGSDRALARYESIRDELSCRLFDLTDAIASFDWDFATVEAWHREMSVEMKREVAWISERETPPARALAAGG